MSSINVPVGTTTSTMHHVRSISDKSTTTPCESTDTAPISPESSITTHTWDELDCFSQVVPMYKWDQSPPKVSLTTSRLDPTAVVFKPRTFSLNLEAPVFASMASTKVKDFESFCNDDVVASMLDPCAAEYIPPHEAESLNDGEHVAAEIGSRGQDGIINDKGSIGEVKAVDIPIFGDDQSQQEEQEAEVGAEGIATELVEIAPAVTEYDATQPFCLDDILHVPGEHESSTTFTTENVSEASPIAADTQQRPEPYTNPGPLIIDGSLTSSANDIECTSETKPTKLKDIRIMNAKREIEAGIRYQNRVDNDIHHRSYFGHPVSRKNSTNPAHSLFVILSASKPFRSVENRYHDLSLLRQFTILNEADKLVDPVGYCGPPEDLYLRGHELIEAVTGRVTKLYHTGHWADDCYGYGDDPVTLDPMSYEVYDDLGITVLNGTMPENTIPLRHQHAEVSNDLYEQHRQAVKSTVASRRAARQRGYSSRCYDISDHIMNAPEASETPTELQFQDVRTVSASDWAVAFNLDHIFGSSSTDLDDNEDDIATKGNISIITVLPEIVVTSPEDDEEGTGNSGIDDYYIDGSFLSPITAREVLDRSVSSNLQQASHVLQTFFSRPLVDGEEEQHRLVGVAGDSLSPSSRAISSNSDMSVEEEDAYIYNSSEAFGSRSNSAAATDYEERVRSLQSLAEVDSATVALQDLIARYSGDDDHEDDVSEDTIAVETLNSFSSEDDCIVSIPGGRNNDVDDLAGPAAANEILPGLDILRSTVGTRQRLTAEQSDLPSLPSSLSLAPSLSSAMPSDTLMKNPESNAPATMYMGHICGQFDNRSSDDEGTSFLNGTPETPSLPLDEYSGRVTLANERLSLVTAEQGIEGEDDCVSSAPSLVLFDSSASESDAETDITEDEEFSWLSLSETWHYIEGNSKSECQPDNNSGQVIPSATPSTTSLPSTIVRHPSQAPVNPFSAIYTLDPATVSLLSFDDRPDAHELDLHLPYADHPIVSQFLNDGVLDNDDPTTTGPADASDLVTQPQPPRSKPSPPSSSSSLLSKWKCRLSLSRRKKNKSSSSSGGGSSSNGRGLGGGLGLKRKLKGFLDDMFLLRNATPFHLENRVVGGVRNHF